MELPEPIQDLIDLKIPEYHRIWKSFMEKYNCQTICELGISRGKNFQLMIEHDPKEAVAVDAWINDGIISRNDMGFSQEVLDEQYECFKSSITTKPFVKLIRDYTDKAAKRFPDNYFDLIYIDADHTFEGCKKDLEAWYPKLKKGRFFIGDDFSNSTTKYTKVKFGVKPAVGKFAERNNLKIYELPQFNWAIIKP